MKTIKPLRSNLVINILIAIVISLVVNFSYLLSMIVAERETNDQRQRMAEQMHKPEMIGVLQLSNDGYGYLINLEPVQTEFTGTIDADSVFVSNRKVRWYNLQNGDTIHCTIFPPRGLSNPMLDEVRTQNGNEIPAPMIYDRPKRYQDTFAQITFYFAFSLLLLSVMTMSIEKQSKVRYLHRCIAVIIITIACYFLTPTVNWQTGKMMVIFQHHPRMMLDWMAVLKCTVVLVVAILYGRIYMLLYEQQKILLENEHLRAENIQSRYNMLVGQINPHFFFNSLNTLAMLVRDKNNEKALEYIDQLSYTFRYIIQNGQNATSTLGDEMEFARAYGELFKVRYADKLFFDIDIDSAYNDWTLPALTLQPLIGNAVKHNTITRKQPFHIVIRTEGPTLVVSNAKAPKLEPEPSTGIGLKNLRSRWQLITGLEFEIIETDSEFIVRLPLQKPEK